MSLCHLAPSPLYPCPPLFLIIPFSSSLPPHLGSFFPFFFSNFALSSNSFWSCRGCSCARLCLVVRRGSGPRLQVVDGDHGNDENRCRWETMEGKDSRCAQLSKKKSKSVQVAIFLFLIQYFFFFYISKIFNKQRLGHCAAAAAAAEPKCTAFVYARCTW